MDLSSTPLCPQCELPQRIKDNRTLRMSCTVICAIIGVGMCFSGALTQIISASMATHVPAKQYCKNLNFEGTNCKDVNQTYALGSYLLRDGQGFEIPCCTGVQDKGPDTMWFGGMQSSSLFVSYSDYYQSAETFYKNTNNKGVQSIASGSLNRYINNNGVQPMQDEATYLAHVTTWQLLHARKLANFNEVSQVIGAIFTIILCILSLLNLTCFSRKGFALVNLSLLAACFAVSWASMYVETDAIIGYVGGTLVVPCKPFNSVLFNDPQFYITPQSTNGKWIEGGTSLLGQYVCGDYKCPPSDSPKAVANACKHEANPVLEHVIVHAAGALIGAIVQFVGFVFLAGVLANIDNPDDAANTDPF